jgi:predicted RNase H-like HicB family nuclease
MPKYELIIYWSEEDQAFIAEVPELPGCAADGKTYREALANVEVVIEEWIETARELGRPIPEPKGRLVFARDQLRVSRFVGEGMTSNTPSSSAARAFRRQSVQNALQFRIASVGAPKTRSSNSSLAGGTGRPHIGQAG